jgi:hypothetical protein
MKLVEIIQRRFIDGEGAGHLAESYIPSDIKMERGQFRDIYTIFDINSVCGDMTKRLDFWRARI